MTNTSSCRTRSRICARLGERLAALQQYRIPTSQRTLPLHKNAPREIEPVSALRRCADSLSAAILGHTDKSGER